MNRQDAAEHVHTVWAGAPAGALCLAVLEMVAEGVLKRLTFGQLGRLAEKIEAEEPDIARAVQYLTGDDFHLLDMEFEFIDEDDEIVHFDLAALTAARRDGGLIHPTSGEEIEDYEDRVFVTFIPSALAKEIAANE